MGSFFLARRAWHVRCRKAKEKVHQEVGAWEGMGDRCHKVAQDQFPVELVPKVNDVAAEEGGLARRGFKEEGGASWSEGQGTFGWMRRQCCTWGSAGAEGGLERGRVLGGGKDAAGAKGLRNGRAGLGVDRTLVRRRSWNRVRRNIHLHPQ